MFYGDTMVNANMLNFTSCKWKLIFDDDWKFALKKPAIPHKCLYSSTHTHVHSFYCHAFFKLFSVTFTYANVVFTFIEIGRVFRLFFFLFFSLLLHSFKCLSVRRRRRKNCARHEWMEWWYTNKKRRRIRVFHEFHSIKVKVFLYQHSPPHSTGTWSAQFQICSVLFFSWKTCILLTLSFQSKINSAIKWMSIYASSELIWKWRSVETITLSINKSVETISTIYSYASLCV